MSYLVLARKFRPRLFDEVCGQEHVTRTLTNAIKRQKVAHAYLFTGLRGVGKTSVARIFARSLNCAKGPSGSPCLQCSNCVEIGEGRNMAVLEIDGASHNSVENVRDLIDSFRSVPPPGSKYKVYIIDEVHMLSTAAFNALLKSLEEPPPHTVFILATTDAHKVPETVISRCQRHDFRALDFEEVHDKLAKIAAQEGVRVDPEVLWMISRLSEGSMRDAESLFERAWAFSEGTITASDASRLFGAVERSVLFELSRAVFAHDAGQALEVVGRAFAFGVDPALFLRDFVSHWRELLISKFAGSKEVKKLGISEIDLVELQRQVESISSEDIQDLMSVARQGADAALRSRYPRYALEALVVRMASRQEVKDLAELIDMLGEKVVRTSNSDPQSARPPATPVTSQVEREKRDKDLSKAPSGATPVSARALDWASFVDTTAQKGSKMLSEHLKRISIEEFSAGVLQGRGPEFTALYLAQPDNRKKLEEALAVFSGVKSWNVKITNGIGEGSAEPGSLHDEENKERVASIKEKRTDISNHPKIKSLRKVFPGTQIEEIKIEE